MLYVDSRFIILHPLQELIIDCSAMFVNQTQVQADLRVVEWVALIRFLFGMCLY